MQDRFNCPENQIVSLRFDPIPPVIDLVVAAVLSSTGNIPRLDASTLSDLSVGTAQTS